MGWTELPRDLRWLFCANFTWMFGMGLYLHILPVYARELGATPEQVGLLYALGYLSATAGLLVSGWLVDRFDRRRILIWSWLFSALAGPFLCLAPGWRWLVPGQVLSWGSMFGYTAVLAYALGTVPPDRAERQPYVVSVVFASIPLGMVVSPWLGGLMAARLGARSTFYAAAALYALSTLLLLPMRPQPPPPPTRAGRGGDPGSPWPIVRLALRVAWGELLLSLTVPVAPVYLAEAGGAGYGTLGLLGSLASLGAGAGAPVLGRLAGRLGYRRALEAGAVLLGAYGALLLAVPRSPAAAALAFLLRGVMDGTRPLRAAAVVAQAGGRTGVALTAANVGWGVCATLGSYLGGWLYRMEPALPFAVTAAGAVAYALSLGRALPGQPGAAAGATGAATRG